MNRALWIFPVAITISFSLAGCGGWSGSPSSVSSTEEIFQDNNTSTVRYSEIQVDEWRQARADHKLLAYAILNCGKLPLDTMSRETFSKLFLDLTPDGNHIFRTTSQKVEGQTQSGPAQSANQGLSSSGEALTLSPHEQRLVALSDSIARTRVMAASTVSGNANKAWWLGLLALMVSGLTTLLVTWQGRAAGTTTASTTTASTTTAVPTGAAAPTVASGQGGGSTAQGPQNTDAQPSSPSTSAGGATTPPPSDGVSTAERRSSWSQGRWFANIAFWAIFFSIVGTVLAGVKQFYDPTRLVVQNGRAIQELNRLHQSVTQGVECKDNNVDYLAPKDMDQWSREIIRLRGAILASYGAFGSDPANSREPLPHTDDSRTDGPRQ